ncbi:hypothetical protein PBCVCvsA1_706R [Paramecium bursaria Chlorella virus CvsA1]|nr:hypothetical protein PBCVCvsA1_706R [Paramecium bursaria Chlorella virus CvsA1]
MISKIVDRAFLGPIIYSFITVFIFALVYGLIGYKNLFETNDENRDKNVENSIVGSLMIQSNAMGIVKPINSLGNWLLTVQTFLGWVYFLCLIYVFVH